MSQVINEEKIKREYIAERHYANLKNYLLHTFDSPQSSFPYIVSFRHTGEYSVMMLEAGAAAKPHTILEKTIKEDTMTAEEAAYPPLTLLYGLTAHREAPGTEIRGLYAVTSDGKSYGRVDREAGETLPSFIARMTGFTEEQVRALEGVEKAEILKKMKEEGGGYCAKRYAGRYVAGDYDLHDLLAFMTQIHPIPSDSAEEFRAMNELNSIFMTGRMDSFPKKDSLIRNPYYPVQHGPQYNYVAHMYNKEPEEPVKEKVAFADFPVAVLNVRSGEIVWTEIDNIGDLQRYYEANYAVMKSSWKDDFPGYISARAGISFEEYMKTKRGNS